MAYDIAAIKFRAHDANTNYNISNYEQELLHFDEVWHSNCVLTLRPLHANNVLHHIESFAASSDEATNMYNLINAICMHISC